MFVFFAYEEKNLWGSQTFVNDLKLGRSPALKELSGELSNIKAMVNFECLGVSELYGWKEGSTAVLADIARTVSDDIAGVNFSNRNIGLPIGADSVPFFYEGIPSITIDSLKAPDDFSKIHSALDNLSNVSESKIKLSLQFSVRYLLELDSLLDMPFVKAGFSRSFLDPPSSNENVLIESFGHRFHPHAHSEQPSFAGAQQHFSPTLSSRSTLLKVELDGTTYVVGFNEDGQLRKLDARNIPNLR